jgi:hypothetical protein
LGEQLNLQALLFLQSFPCAIKSGEDSFGFPYLIRKRIWKY